MTNRLKQWRKVSLAILATTIGVHTAGAAVPLAENGEARAVIVHNGHTAPAPNLAPNHVRQKHIQGPAETLATYLSEMTGAEFEQVAAVAAAGQRPAIVLQLVASVPGASDRATGSEAYRIHTDGNRLLLTASTPLGLHNAVFGLLEDHLGCRFYSFKRQGLHYGGRGFEVVPRRPTLRLENIDDFQEPAFANRGLIFSMGSYPWLLQNRGIGRVGDHTSGALAAGHNMYGLLPPRDSGNVKGLFADHPEFYPLNKAGQRQPDWAYGICGTNPELPTFLAAGIERDIARRIEHTRTGDVDWSMPFSAAQGDGFSGCHCDECRELVHAEESEAAPLILALNRALDIINRTYPQAQVITFAYFETLDRPKSLKPHDKLWINVVSSARSQNHAGDQMGPIVGNPANRDYERAIREWPGVAPDRVTVWHWDTYRAEWPSMFFVGENLRLMRDAGIYGINSQTCGGPWQDMLEWLYLKLAWNPELDNEALVRQFCEDVYGVEAGAHVFAYLKLGKAAYEGSLHVPSAVRWSGWTPTIRLKLFPPPVLEQMTAAMDRALAAAERAGDKVRLANLIGARGQSLDVVVLDEIQHSGQPWGPAHYAADGKNWFVAGGDERVPPSLMRAKQGIRMSGGGEHGVLRSITWYVEGRGGPLVELGNEKMQVAVCPDLKGRIVSAVDRETGRELLANRGANSGYVDEFSRISSQIWLPADTPAEDLRHPRAAQRDWTRTWSEFENPNDQRLDTLLVLSPPYYGFDPSRSLRRTVALDGSAVRIERTYTGNLAHPNRFTTRWSFALPKPKLAKIAVRGGGIDSMLDLRYAVPGGIKGVKAGERLPGADWMDERFDSWIAVADAEVTRFAVEQPEGEIAITLDRGDGLAAVLTIPATGWEAIEIKPVVDQNYLEVALLGAVRTVDGGTAENVALPHQLLASRRVAPAVKLSDKSDESDPSDQPSAPPRLRLTGENTAVNEADGAELVWIPAGPFLRGSESPVAGSDEGPLRELKLDGYWIYKHPVTLAQYKTFCEAVGKDFVPTWGQGMHAEPAGDPERHPVQMNWYEARDYAQAMGGDLPTEAQWEKAARGTDGREYPWGNEWEPAKCVSMEETLYAFTPGFRPVGSYPEGASPYGAMDMAGSVWEWVRDWYAHLDHEAEPASNPTGPEAGSHKVLRGGCSLYDERFSRTTAKMPMPPHVRDWTPTGFRVVVEAPGPGDRGE